MIGIGIDTGGTCTDAVVYDFETREILGTGKAMTTKQNLEIGIANALDTLPPELVAKADSIALSTTLATNASLENKGARAKLLLIGFHKGMMAHLQEVFASYGMQDMARFIILEAKSEGVFSNPVDPDWEDLRRQCGHYFEDCDSVGIVQTYPRSNGGRFELTALKILQEELTIPVTISYDISNEIDVVKTCAGTMLNAMLIPLITEFMGAISHVCQRRGLDIPISIILSNGTMVPAATASQYPVETILCGPAASVVGGSALAGEDDGIIVDMGGTTTDMAIVRKQIPVPAKGGIKIGQWKTMVQGIFVDTIGLGGDSAVLVNENEHTLHLDVARVIPISVLAAEYDHVLPLLQNMEVRRKYSNVADYSFYVLLKDVADKIGYTDEERALCDALREKPLTISELAGRLDSYPRFLPVRRLESDGVIIRSGLTPTDMMILKGDFTLYDGEAARIATQYLANTLRCEPEAVPDMVYELVVHKMYNALARVILSQRFPKIKEMDDPAYLAPILEASYTYAKTRLDDPEAGDAVEDDLRVTTRFPLIGVGAPIHIFLPRVAALLGTRAVVPEHSGVANAVGAVVSRRVAQVQLIVDAIYRNARLVGFELPDEGSRPFFEKYDDALAYGKVVVRKSIEKKAALFGIENPRIEISEKDSRLNGDTGLILGMVLTATATE